MVRNAGLGVWFGGKSCGIGFGLLDPNFVQDALPFQLTGEIAELRFTLYFQHHLHFTLLVCTTDRARENVRLLQDKVVLWNRFT